MFGALARRLFGSANDRYVKIAIGRDYKDVPPTRGTYQGGGTERLTVAVTVRALD